MKYGFFLLCLVLFFAGRSFSQNLVYVDNNGVLRYTKTKKEAAFFGVNYTVPFAYGYRSHRALGIDPETAIKNDVYHFARLGLDAFRVHVWDTEITDSLGNLLENEHLRLFDFLVYQLKQRNIKIFLTPLAFWGNGYPQPDVKTGSFSSIYNKQQVLVTEPAIRAQEQYIKQLLQHINPYTKLTYGQDSDIIALEINNEPHHSGTKQQAKDYIDRMVHAVRSSGWTKPLFYNISESPAYADVVARSAIDGVSFQWYPTGLVANRTLKGNMLPHVDRYRIPFDTIQQYKNKARMVYEFDAGDVLESYMYPAMSRSFRTAGFQWATQFAYDPVHTAYGNTEYQTHYLNLAYTPSKAISLLIASKVFHNMPRLHSYGNYPADTAFGAFRVSYKNDLSEMNAADAFYYSNHTTTKPVNLHALQHIAGVGNSPVVLYSGTGAYFLDRVSKGVWRLEVMPDAIHIRDPFEKASPGKEVTRIQWNTNVMEIKLPDLGSAFHIKGLNKENTRNDTSRNNRFSVSPGAYLLTVAQTASSGTFRVPGFSIVSNEYVAPQPFSSNPFIAHTPIKEIIAGNEFRIAAKITGIDSADRVTVEMRNTSNKWKTLILQRKRVYDFETQVPADMVTPGLLQYRIIIRKKDNSFIVAPGHFTTDPYAWDTYTNESWQTWVVPESAPLTLYNAFAHRNEITSYNPAWRKNTVEYITAQEPGLLVMKATLLKEPGSNFLGFQHHFAEETKARLSHADGFSKLVIKAGVEGNPVQVRIALVTTDARVFAKHVTIDHNLKEYELPISELRPDSLLLLPRPYPGFLPLWFQSSVTLPLDLSEVESIQISFGEHMQEGKTYFLHLASVFL